MKGMRETRLFAWAGAVVSLVCLVAGFGWKGYWAILLVLPALALFWLLLRKVSRPVTLSILFFIYLLVAAAGLLMGAPASLILIGSGFALVAWESAYFLSHFQGLSVASADPRLERLHNGDLLIAAGSGVLLGLLGLGLHFQLPFGVIAVLALAGVYGLYRGYTLLNRTP